MELTKTSKKRLFLDVEEEVEKYLYIEERARESYKKQSDNLQETFLAKSKSLEFNSELKIIDMDTAPTFSKLVKEYMNKKEITSKDIYKNSLIDRKLFSSLNVNDNYMPSKETAIMYCFALKLTLDEAKDLLNSAGYSFYKYSNFDIIVTYFLNNQLYNIDKLNDTLYHYTKKCIGYR